MLMRTTLVTTVLLFTPFLAQANFDLTLRSRHTTFPVEGVKKINDEKTPAIQGIHLTIGGRWVQWDNGSDAGVYDFEKRVVIRVDSHAQRLDEESMYALLSGRTAELDNRLMLGNVVRASKAENNPMAPTLVEHQLSLRHDAKRPSGIERKSAGSEQTFLWQQKELFAYSKEIVPLPAAARDLYIRYVRYTIGGHPEILADLEKLDGVPRWIRYSDPAYGDTRQLELINSKETPNAPYVLPALKKATLANTDAAAAAAVVILAGAGEGYRWYRGQVAKDQVMLAMRITAGKLNHIQTHLREARQ